MGHRVAQISIMVVSFLAVETAAGSLDRNKLLEYNQTKDWYALRVYLTEALTGNNTAAYLEMEGIPSSENAPMHLIGREGYDALADELAIPESGADLVDSAGYTMLHGAAIGGRVDTARLLQAHGADLEARDRDGSTAMLLAARHGSLPLVRYLTIRGADVNAENRQRQSALYWSVYNGDQAMQAWLVDHGAVIPTAGWSAV
ncbi:ankyrin homolog [Bacillus rossius redtenbacheri]|uniref:ankyrin homolog n=1 Tax=Bacillus rossius redtenbacheri TaxID=93214 RepID=UPI002FDEB90A